MCQKYKRTYQKYGHLPEKEAEGQPWEKLCVDLIGPYNIARSNNEKAHFGATIGATFVKNKSPFLIDDATVETVDETDSDPAVSVNQKDLRMKIQVQSLKEWSLI